MPAPKRLWILNCDARGLGPHARKYQTTAAAVRGWSHHRLPGGKILLVDQAGPRDLTAAFEEFDWPTGVPDPADPEYQKALARHRQICEAPGGPLWSATVDDPHSCPWTEQHRLASTQATHRLTEITEAIERAL